jgi:hypothetical protein
MFFKSKKDDLLIASYPGGLSVEAKLNIERNLAEKFPDARVVVMDNGGHLELVRLS